MDVAPPVVPLATAYAAQTDAILAAAMATAPGWFGAQDRQLAREFSAAPAMSRHHLARFLRRTRRVLGFEDQAWPAIAQARDTLPGWIEAGAGNVLRVRGRAANLVDDATSLVFADAGATADDLVRLGLSARPVPAWSGLAHGLAGLPPPFPVVPPYPDRAGLRVWREITALIDEPVDEPAARLALDAIAEGQGQPLPLIGWQFDLRQAWARRAWVCVENLGRRHPLRLRLLRALARSPLSPALARRVARAWWGLLGGRRWARRAATAAAAWNIWHPGERDRWRRRAGLLPAAIGDEDRVRERLTARLVLDRGQVLADGEPIERHVLRRYRADGWEGLHGEGGAWLGIAWVLGQELLAQPVPGAWAGPWQVLPCDWARYGFLARRRLAADAWAQGLRRDPVGKWCAARERLADAWWPGLPRPPGLEAGRAIVAAVPALTLVRWCRMLLDQPQWASGLPDLVLWRAGRLALREVKSPGDRLGDNQRWWLDWLANEGLDVGVVRVDAAGPVERRAPLASDRRPRRPARRSAGVWRLLLAGRSCPVVAGGQIQADLAFGREASIGAERWDGTVGGRGVSGWDRPVLGVARLPVGAVSLADDGRRWWPVPAGWWVPLLVGLEAAAEGGLRRTAHLLLRRVGWMVPASSDGREPVVLPPEVAVPAPGQAAVDWLPHPESPPWRVENHLAPELMAQAAGQLAMVAGQDHCLRPHGDGAEMALADPDACLWLVASPRLRRGRLFAP